MHADEAYSIRVYVHTIPSIVIMPVLLVRRVIFSRGQVRLEVRRGWTSIDQLTPNLFSFRLHRFSPTSIHAGQVRSDLCWSVEFTGEKWRIWSNQFPKYLYVHNVFYIQFTLMFILHFPYSRTFCAKTWFIHAGKLTSKCQYCSCVCLMEVRPRGRYRRGLPPAVPQRHHGMHAGEGGTCHKVK